MIKSVTIVMINKIFNILWFNSLQVMSLNKGKNVLNILHQFTIGFCLHGVNIVLVISF